MAKASAQITLHYIIDIKASYRYYLLQGSTLAKPSKPTAYPPDSTWDDTEPSYEEGSTNSLYFVDCTVFCDDTFTYSEVSLSSSYEAAKLAYNKASNAQDSADAAQDKAEETDERVSVAESLIQQLSDSISMLVTDENGSSLMTQTDTGWTFSMAEINTALNDVSNSLDTLQQEVGDTENTVTVLEQAVNDLGVLAEYVKVTTYEDEPCIELGEGDSDFKLLITNTRIMFMEGSDVPAYINNQSLYIKKAVVEEELQQGGFVWKVRSNGNMGLMWKGVSE